jgi:hypothetical protein
VHFKLSKQRPGSSGDLAGAELRGQALPGEVEAFQHYVLLSNNLPPVTHLHSNGAVDSRFVREMNC